MPFEFLPGDKAVVRFLFTILGRITYRYKVSNAKFLEAMHKAICVFAHVKAYGNVQFVFHASGWASI